MAPPRIALALPTLGGGGAERVAITLAQGFLARGDAVDFVLGQAKGAFIGSVPAGARVIDLGAIRMRDTVRPMARYLSEIRPDAVHASMWPMTSYTVLAHRLARSQATLVLTDHVNLSAEHAKRGFIHGLAMRLSMATTYRAADAVSAVSQGVARDIAKLACLPQGRVLAIYNPIPRAEHGSGAKSPWHDEGARILSVGSLKPQKNHALLLDAFAELLKYRQAQLTIVGEGPLRPVLEQRAEDLGIQEKVRFVGFVEDPSSWYRSADLFVLSSDFEGFGNVLVEALDHGLRVVSTDCPDGPAEILKSGRHGTLVPAGDVLALAGAMHQTLSTPADPAAARERAGDFAPERTIEHYRTLLLARRPA